MILAIFDTSCIQSLGGTRWFRKRLGPESETHHILWLRTRVLQLVCLILILKLLLFESRGGIRLKVCINKDRGVTITIAFIFSVNPSLTILVSRLTRICNSLQFSTSFRPRFAGKCELAVKRLDTSAHSGYNFTVKPATNHSSSSWCRMHT